MKLLTTIALLLLMPVLSVAGEQKAAAGDRCDDAQPTRLYMSADNTVLICKKGSLSMASPQELAAIGDATKAKAASVRKAIEILKREAKPVAAGETIKDPAGCLYGINYQNGRLGLVQILDEQKRPVCGA